MRLWLALLLLFIALPAHADEFDYSDFRRLPVLEDGRLKPLESFARNMQYRLAGRIHQPTQWLAQVIFMPGTVGEIASFKVANAHVRAAFNLPAAPGKLYSLAQLADGLARTADEAEALGQRKPADLTADEQDLLALHVNVLLYNQLVQSLSPLLPLPTTNATYLELQGDEQARAAQLETTITPEQRSNPDLLSEAQQAEILQLMSLEQLRRLGQNNMLLRVIPASWQAGEWLAPWQVILQGQGGPETSVIFTSWQAMATAYRNNDVAGWREAAAQLHTQLGTQRLDAEVLYHDLHFYEAALLALLVSMLLAGIALRRPSCLQAAWFALAAASLLITLQLAGRVYILARPPVGTLYESLLFVALIAGLGALWLVRTTRQPSLLLAGSIGVFIMLLAAPLIKSDAESLTVLTAVLNTNFWLTVHVLCITAGYGACILTALMAHVLLAVQGTSYDMPERQPLLHKVSLWALLLTAVGTLLGGVWADQSWGRFWGWDPKENGALIIVLWLIWAQHARLAGQFGRRAYTTALALLSVVVAQAWFGVNLLSTGLHSYGFIEGVALGLFSFTAAELALIAGLYYLSLQREKHAA